MEKLDETNINSWTEKRAFPRIAHHNDVKVHHPERKRPSVPSIEIVVN